MTSFAVSLPDDVAARAKRVGLLSDDGIRALIEDALGRMSVLACRNSSLRNKNPPIMRITYRSRAKRGGCVATKSMGDRGGNAILRCAYVQSLADECHRNSAIPRIAPIIAIAESFCASQISPWVPR